MRAFIIFFPAYYWGNGLSNSHLWFVLMVEQSSLQPWHKLPVLQEHVGASGLQEEGREVVDLKKRSARGRRKAQGSMAGACAVASVPSVRTLFLTKDPDWEPGLRV